MKTIGKYIIRGLLGRGGMSKVFKVEIPYIAKIAALKLLDPHPILADMVGMEKLRELFSAEAVKLAGIRHPNIVEIWDFGEIDGRPYYLMDYYFNHLATMIGESNRTELPTRVIKLDNAIRLTRQMLEGLACLHHNGIIHRDIKPFNLLLTENDTLKICDFGLSKLRGEKVSVPRNIKVGSPFYAAPEQESDPENVDRTVDLYSTGVTLYRMLAGNLPSANPEPISRVNPDLNDAWDHFLTRSIAPIAADRFNNANEMLLELNELDRDWQERKGRSCAMAEPGRLQDRGEHKVFLRLRKQALKVTSQQAANVFGIDDLWRPAEYICNQYAPGSNGTITDETTGLIWQQAGSAYQMNWQNAAGYIAQLNRKQFASLQTWRLPTINELMSLLIKTPHGEDYCIESLFDLKQKALWSMDKRSFTSAWYVSIDMGFVAWQDFSAYFHVRAVSDV